MNMVDQAEDIDSVAHANKEPSGISSPTNLKAINDDITMQENNP